MNEKEFKPLIVENRRRGYADIGHKGYSPEAEEMNEELADRIAALYNAHEGSGLKVESVSLISGRVISDDGFSVTVRVTGKGTLKLASEVEERIAAILKA